MAERVIPASLDAEVVRRLAADETSESIAADLSKRLGKKIHGRRVREIGEKHTDAIGHVIEVASKTKTAVGPQVEALALNANLVLDESVRLATYDIGDAYPALKALLPEDVRRAVCGLEFYEDGTTIKRLRFATKDASLDRLAKNLGLFEKDHKQGAGAFAALLLAAQRKRRVT